MRTQHPIRRRSTGVLSFRSVWLRASRPGDIDQNTKTLCADLTLRDEDRRVLAEFCSRAFESPVVQKMKVV